MIPSFQAYSGALQSLSLGSHAAVTDIQGVLEDFGRCLHSGGLTDRPVRDFLSLLNVAPIASRFGPAVAEAALAYLGVQREALDLTIERKIGQGCASEVFLAHETESRRPVALKVYRPFQKAVREDEVPMRGLFNELRFQAAIGDRAVARVLRCGLTAGANPYLGLEYLPEGSLADVVSSLAKSGEPYGPRDQHLAAGALAAASAVHGAGIVHGDMSIENFLVGLGGGVKLADFAMARRLSEPSYSFEGRGKFKEPEGLAYDVFQLGKVLYRIFTRHPYDISDMTVRRAPVPGKKRPDLRIPSWVDEMVTRSLSASPTESFSDAAAMRDFFLEHASG